MAAECLRGTEPGFAAAAAHVRIGGRVPRRGFDGGDCQGLRRRLRRPRARRLRGLFCRQATLPLEFGTVGHGRLAGRLAGRLFRRLGGGVFRRLFRLRGLKRIERGDDLVHSLDRIQGARPPDFLHDLLAGRLGQPRGRDEGAVGVVVVVHVCEPFDDAPEVGAPGALHGVVPLGVVDAAAIHKFLRAVRHRGGGRDGVGVLVGWWR